jgi:hypothetical protein
VIDKDGTIWVKYNVIGCNAIYQTQEYRKHKHILDDVKDLVDLLRCYEKLNRTFDELLEISLRHWEWVEA